MPMTLNKIAGLKTRAAGKVREKLESLAAQQTPPYANCYFIGRGGDSPQRLYSAQGLEQVRDLCRRGQVKDDDSYWQEDGHVILASGKIGELLSRHKSDAAPIGGAIPPAENPIGQTIAGGDGPEYGPLTGGQIRAWLAARRADLDRNARMAGDDAWEKPGTPDDLGSFDRRVSRAVGGVGSKIEADASRRLNPFPRPGEFAAYHEISPPKAGIGLIMLLIFVPFIGVPIMFYRGAESKPIRILFSGWLALYVILFSLRLGSASPSVSAGGLNASDQTVAEIAPETKGSAIVPNPASKRRNGATEEAPPGPEAQPAESDNSIGKYFGPNDPIVRRISGLNVQNALSAGMANGNIEAAKMSILGLWTPDNYHEKLSEFIETKDAAFYLLETHNQFNPEVFAQYVRGWNYGAGSLKMGQGRQQPTGIRRRNLATSRSITSANCRCRERISDDETWFPSRCCPKLARGLFFFLLIVAPVVLVFISFATLPSSLSGCWTRRIGTTKQRMRNSRGDELSAFSSDSPDKA